MFEEGILLREKKRYTEYFNNGANSLLDATPENIWKVKEYLAEGMNNSKRTKYICII